MHELLTVSDISVINVNMLMGMRVSWMLLAKTG